MITQDEVLSLFDYKDGNLFWKRNGKLAGSVNSHGYRNIQIDGKTHKSHRLIWLMHFGDPLPEIIDHANGNKQDNRIENLREATINQNNHNSRIGTRNKSGVKGVYFDKQNNKWRVQLAVNGKLKSFGLFNNIAEAEAAAIAARNDNHGEFANHG